MKKLWFILFLISSLLCIQNRVFSQNENNSVILQENSMENAQQDSSAPTYQPEYKPAFLKMFFILFALLVLIFLTFWFFKRFMNVRLHQANLTKNIKILERRALSPKTILYLIEIEEKKVLICESNLEVRKIKDLD